MGIAKAHGIDQRVNEAAEAISGALYRVDFEHLGDTDEGRTTWFTRGDTAANRVRVSVERSTLYPAVFVVMEYLNRHVNKVGRAVHQLDCNARLDDVREASEKLVKRILEQYRDVITGTGIASREAYEEQMRRQAASRN